MGGARQEMAVIGFKQIPQVALEFMNHDHAEAIVLLSQLTDAVEVQDGPTITQALQALLDHNREHFGREEAQMQAFRFPPYPVHKGEHDAVLAEMQRQLEAWRQTGDIEMLREYVDRTLPYWFVNHISTMDMVTAQFIANQGGPKAELLA